MCVSAGFLPSPGILPFGVLEEKHTGHPPLKQQHRLSTCVAEPSQFGEPAGSIAPSCPETPHPAISRSSRVPSNRLEQKRIDHGSRESVDYTPGSVPKYISGRHCNPYRPLLRVGHASVLDTKSDRCEVSNHLHGTFEERLSPEVPELVSGQSQISKPDVEVANIYNSINMYASRECRRVTQTRVL